ncbi:MAG: hypothetical protein IPF56_23860 [Chloroflexi bacterium]|nr:hypothetical protein [Chloroflexota bacterium]
MQVLHLHWLTPPPPGENGHAFFWLETAVALNPPVTGAKRQPNPTPSPPIEMG